MAIFKPTDDWYTPAMEWKDNPSIKLIMSYLQPVLVKLIKKYSANFLITKIDVEPDNQIEVLFEEEYYSAFSRGVRRVMYRAFSITIDDIGDTVVICVRNSQIRRVNDNQDICVFTLKSSTNSMYRKLNTILKHNFTASRKY